MFNSLIEYPGSYTLPEPVGKLCDESVNRDCVPAGVGVEQELAEFSPAAGIVSRRCYVSQFIPTLSATIFLIVDLQLTALILGLGIGNGLYLEAPTQAPSPMISAFPVWPEWDSWEPGQKLKASPRKKPANNLPQYQAPLQHSQTTPQDQESTSITRLKTTQKARKASHTVCHRHYLTKRSHLTRFYVIAGQKPDPWRYVVVIS